MVMDKDSARAHLPARTIHGIDTDRSQQTLGQRLLCWSPRNLGSCSFAGAGRPS